MHCHPGEARRSQSPGSEALRRAVRRGSRHLARLGVAANTHGVALMSQVLMQGLVL